MKLQAEEPAAENPISNIYVKLYRELYAEIEQVRKEGRQSFQQTADSRSVLPIPNTSNHMYGWLASKREFIVDRNERAVIKKIFITKPERNQFDY